MDLIVVGRSIVDVNDIGVFGAVAVESDNEAVLTGTGVDVDGGNTAAKVVCAIGKSDGVGGSGTTAEVVFDGSTYNGDGKAVVKVIEPMDTDDVGLVEGVVINCNENAVSILRHDGITDVIVGDVGAVDTVDMTPETGFVRGIVYFAEVGGYPAVGDIGVFGHVFLDSDSKHAAGIGTTDGVARFVTDKETMVEDMVEGMEGMGSVENDDGVAGFDLEARVANFNVFTTTTNGSEGVDSETDAVFGRVVVGFPEGDLTDSGATGNLVGGKGLIAGPNLSVGIVGEVFVGTTQGAVTGRDEDGATGFGLILSETGGSHFTAIAFPEDVGHVVGVATGAIVPGGVVGTAVVFHAGFDEGATVAVGAGDDGTVGGDSKTVDLDIVQATVVVDKSGAGGSEGVDTAVGGNKIDVLDGACGLIPVGVAYNLLDAGMDKLGVGIDG